MVKVGSMTIREGRVVVDGREFVGKDSVTISDDGTVEVDGVPQEGKVGEPSETPIETPIDKMPRYRSHKSVRAAPIAWWRQAGTGPIEVHVTIDGTRHVIEAPPTTFIGGAAVVGDYLVVFDDGYISWSPREPFEDSFTRVGAKP